jgi:hypothetical protein
LNTGDLTGTWRTFRNERHEGPRQLSDPSLPEREREHAALIDNRYKLHQLADGHFELYDLVIDPAETRDLAPEMPEVVRELSAVLHRWQRSVEDSLKGKDYVHATAASR